MRHTCLILFIGVSAAGWDVASILQRPGARDCRR
jgi:hypothetical protein